MGFFWTTFFYIVVMIAVIVAAYVATKYLSGKGRHLQSRNIRILDRMMLGRDKHVVLIEVGDKNLLIGVTNQAINVLGDIDGETLRAEPGDTQASMQKGLASQLHDFIVNMKNAPDNLKKARVGAKKTHLPKSTGEDDYLSRMDDAIQKRKNHMTDGWEKEAE